MSNENNSMNVDDESLPQNDRDVEMEASTNWVYDAGWIVNAQPTNSNTNSVGFPLDDNEDTNMGNSLDDDASTSTRAVPQANDPTTSVTRLPRATRFVDIQSISDDRVLHALMSTLEKQIERVVSAGVRNIVDNATSQPAKSEPSTSANTPFTAQVQGVSAIDSSTSDNSTATVGNNYENRSSDNQTGASEHTALPVDFSSDLGMHTSVHRSGEQEEVIGVKVTHSDFQSFIHSFERLTANVQTLIEQGGNLSRPTARSNPPQVFISGRDLFQRNDEREEASAQMYKKRPIKENVFHKILRNLLVEYGLRTSRRQKIFILKDSVPKAQADAYNAGRGDGPTLNDLQLDWTEPMTTPWNSTTIYILTNHVLERLKNNFYSELKYEDWMTDERIFSELKEKLTQSKDEYENSIGSNAPDADNDAAESRARYASRKSQKTVRNRRNMRRRTVLL